MLASTAPGHERARSTLMGRTGRSVRAGAAGAGVARPVGTTAKSRWTLTATRYSHPRGAGLKTGTALNRKSAILRSCLSSTAAAQLVPPAVAAECPKTWSLQSLARVLRKQMALTSTWRCMEASLPSSARRAPVGSTTARVRGRRTKRTTTTSGNILQSLTPTCRPMAPGQRMARASPTVHGTHGLLWSLALLAQRRRQQQGRQRRQRARRRSL